MTATRPNLQIRPGLRIVTSCRQRRLGGQKYPGRRGRPNAEHEANAHNNAVLRLRRLCRGEA